MTIWLTVLAPLTLLPGLANRWLWPPIVVMVLAALLATFTPPRGRLPRALVIASGVAAVVVVVTALLGDAPLAQIMGRTPRYEGVPVLIVIVLAVWLGARQLGPGATQQDATHFTRAVSVAAILVGALALLETLGLRPIESDLDRPGSFAGNSSDQAISGVIYLALTAAIVLGAIKRAERLPTLAIVGSAAAAVAVITSASRAGVAVAAVLAVVIAVLVVRASAHRGHAALISAGAIVAGFVAIWSIPTVRERFDGSEPLAVQSFTGRGDIWAAAIAVWQKSPVIGVGPNGFQDAVVSTLPDDWYATGNVDFVLNSPHNLVLQVLVTGGIIGLLIALAVVALFVCFAWRTLRGDNGARTDAVIGAALAVPAAAAILMTHLTSPKTTLIVAPLVGILVAQPLVKRASVAVRRVGSAALAGALAIVVVWTIADANLRAGELAAARGDLAAAESSFDFVAAVRPWDGDIALDAARAISSGPPSEAAAVSAVEWAMRAADLLPHSAVALEAAGSTLMQMGRTSEAVAYLADAAAIATVNPRVQHQYGVSLLMTGDYEGARAALERTLQLDPMNEVSRAALDEACRLGNLTCAD